MQKIKITSTSRIYKPKALENIDVSYGISYLAEDYSVKTVDDNNSWSMKLLANIDNLMNVFSTKRKINDEKEIISQIIEDSQFLDKYYNEDSQNLHIQINNDNKIIKGLSYFSKQSKEKIQLGINSSIAFFRFSDVKKRIFLGLDLFQNDNSFYLALSNKLSRKEIASFVFLHEYSHSVEIDNYGKYKTKIENESFDRFYKNLCVLADAENFEEVKKTIQGKKEFFMPTQGLSKTLHMLHKEIYSDAHALLLMRNKSILNGNFNEAVFNQIIEGVTEARKEEQLLNQIRTQDFERNTYIEKGLVVEIFPYNDHFTSPGIESLSSHLTDFIKDQTNDKLLSNEDMHKIVVKCVEEGIAKTLLMMQEAMPYVQPQLNTIFSIRQKNGQLVIAEGSNNFDDAMKKINRIVPVTWKESFRKNLEKMCGRNPCIVFDAAMNQKQFDDAPRVFNGMDFSSVNVNKVDDLTKKETKNISEDNNNFSSIDIQTIQKNIANIRTRLITKLTSTKHNTFQ